VAVMPGGQPAPCFVPPVKFVVTDSVMLLTVPPADDTVEIGDREDTGKRSTICIDGDEVDIHPLGIIGCDAEASIVPVKVHCAPAVRLVGRSPSDRSLPRNGPSAKEPVMSAVFVVLGPYCEAVSLCGSVTVAPSMATSFGR